MAEHSAGAERPEPGDGGQEEEEGDVFEVEQIIDMRTSKGEVLYRVRWKGYSSGDDTWEPESHLEDCDEVLQTFKRKLGENKAKKDSMVEGAQVERTQAVSCSTVQEWAPEVSIGADEEQVAVAASGAQTDTSQEKLPMKSDLFDADSESEGDRKESPSRKVKKKKKVKEGYSAADGQRKDKKEKKNRSDQAAGPESKDSEEGDSESAASVADAGKPSKAKKRAVEPAEELKANKRQKKEESKGLAKHRKDPGKSKKKHKGSKEHRSDAEKQLDSAEDSPREDAAEPQAEPMSVPTEGSGAESLAPSSSEKTSLPTQGGPDPCSEQGPPEQKAACKKTKAPQLGETKVKALLVKEPAQEKRSGRPEGQLQRKESTHAKLKNLLLANRPPDSTAKVHKAPKSATEDEPGFLSSDSNEGGSSVKKKGKGKARDASPRAPSRAKLDEAKLDPPSGAGAAGKGRDAGKPARPEEPMESPNLFEKFLLTCEAKDRMPRRPSSHTPSSAVEDKADQTKISPKPPGKPEKKMKSVKEVPVQRPEPEKVEKTRKESKTVECAPAVRDSFDVDQSPSDEAEERPERADEPPEPRDRWERRPEVASPEPGDEAVGRWSSGVQRERRRRREDSEPRLYIACDESHDAPDPLGHADKGPDRGQPVLNLGMDLKLDWMTVEDFQKHLNGQDDILSAATISSSELRESVKSGDYLTVKLALNSKEDYNLDQEDSSGMSLAMLAAAGGQDDILRLLITKGVKLNARQKAGTTALMHAAEKNFLPTVAILLEAGAYVNAQQSNGETALMKACRKGNAEIVRLLLEYGADCNILSKHQNSALHFAKLSNNVLVYDLIKSHMDTLSSVAEDTIRDYFETRLALLEPVFPLACHRLCEGPDFSLEFNYKSHSPTEGSGILLFIFHANFFGGNEITARLCGPCSVQAVVLNDKFQLPVFLDSHFIYSFSPVQGMNKLFIRLCEAPTAKVKLLISAYRVQLQ
ncbi:MPP8 phase, partial [Atractosteus spatula]|nr:MPP8 phase [Atractosteus spatula]